MIQSIFELIINTLSEHHEGYPLFIQKHCGKLCQFNMGRWSKVIRVHHSGILFCDNLPTDNHIYIEIADMLSLLGLGDKPQIRFQGDISFCQDLAKLLSTQKIDIDALLLSLLPEGLALFSIEGKDLIKNTVAHSKSQLTLLLKDYLIHETGLCVEQKEANLLYEKTLRLKWLIESLKHNKLCNSGE